MAIYPKSCGDKVTFAEYNCVKCNSDLTKQTLEDNLETAINISKLQFCQNVSDIAHDYLVVDSFIDSTGWNNTVCSTYTTSTYCNSALTGYYVNCSSSTSLPNYSVLLCSVSGGTVTIGCYYVTAQACSVSSTCTANVLICVCSDYLANFCCYDSFCFRINRCVITNTNDTCFKIITSNWQDNTSLVCEFVTVNCSFSNCYCYVCVCPNCYDFYCDGACKCQITLSAFPNINFCAYAWKNLNSCTFVRICMDCICITQNCSLIKICGVPINWGYPIKFVYYTDEAYGSGTRVYNVIDSSTGCCIATNVPANCVYLLGCCVCCHTYEIVQCSDNTSCIKGYTIAVGK